MKYHVFLSYNSLDSEIAETLYSYLKNSGFRTFYDKVSILPGDTWTKTIEESIENSDSILILIGKNGFGKWQDKEQYLFQILSTNIGNKKIIPVILPDLANDFSSSNLPGFLKSIQVFRFKKMDENEILRLLQSIPRNFSLILNFERPFLENEQNDLLERTIQFYNKEAETYFKKWKDYKPSALIEFNSKLKNQFNSAKVLDVGCGPGHHTKFLCSEGHNVIGIDLCQKFIEMAKIDKPKNCEFIHLDMRNLYNHFLRRNIFDAIWACASVFHLSKENLSNLLYQFMALLKPNGILGISLQVEMPSAVQEDGRFFERYEQDDIKSILLNHGFYITDTIYHETNQNTLNKKQLKKWCNYFLLAPENKEKLIFDNKNFAQHTI